MVKNLRFISRVEGWNDGRMEFRPVFTGREEGWNPECSGGMMEGWDPSVK